VVVLAIIHLKASVPVEQACGLLPKNTIHPLSKDAQFQDQICILTTSAHRFLRAMTAAVTPAAITVSAAAATAALVVLLAVIHLKASVPSRPGGRGIMVTAV
jgi:hypothetical protein